MAWKDLFNALALMIILEAVLPFLNPNRFRQALELVSQLHDRQIRTAGLFCMLAGVMMLYFIN